MLFSLASIGPVNNVNLYPYREYYDVGDVITCEAEGYPEPRYQWLRLDDGKFFFKVYTLSTKSLCKC